MPQVIAAYVATYAVTAYAALSYTAIYAVTYAATVYAMNAAFAAISKQQGKSGRGSGMEVAVIDSSADGRVIYGSPRVAGVHVIPALCSGIDGDVLHMCQALAVHEVDSFGDWYLDDSAITQAEITAITGSANDGVVTGSSKFENNAWLRGYTGTTTQNVDFILNAAFASSFDATFRGRGITYLAAAFKWGKGKVYTGGIPNVSVIVNGKKCYDPRLDASPGAAPTNPAFAATTTNPALIWADYKTNTIYGQKVDAADIDWTCVVNAANVCDALVAIPSATTQKRYTFSGVMSTAADTTDNEKSIIDSMMGKMAFSAGLWRIFAGAWRSPEFSIAKEDWVSIGSIQTTASRNDSRFNGVVVYHVDSSRKWQRVEAYRRYNDTYKSADAGERIWIELDQPFCMSGLEAQRKGEFMLRQSRNGVKIVGTLPPRFMKLRSWDNVTVTFAELGWASKTFTVSSCSPRPDGAVDVTLTEEQDTDWTDLIEAEYNAPSISSVPAINPTTPSAPTMAITSNIGGTLTFNIDEPVTRPTGTNYQIIRSLVSSNAAVGTVIYDGVTRFITLSSPTSANYYWARAYANSYYSPYYPTTTGLTAIASGMNAGQAVPNAFTYVTMANCTATQTFSKGGIALYASEMGRIDFPQQSDDADVIITATFRAGLGNFNLTNRIGIQFVTGVTSSYQSTIFQPNGGTTTDPRPGTIQHIFQYSRTNSAYALLFWDAASGPNSVVIDNVSLTGEFIKR